MKDRETAPARTLCFAAVMLLGTAAGAAPAAGPGPGAQDIALRTSQADRLFAAGQFDAAGSLYFAVGAETRDFGYLCFVARCHERLGRLDEAITAVRQCLAGLQEGSPAKRDEYQAFLAQLEARAGSVPTPPPVVPALPAGGVVPPSRPVAAAPVTTAAPPGPPANFQPPAPPALASAGPASVVAAAPGPADLSSGVDQTSSQRPPHKRSLAGIITGASIATVGLLGGAVCAKGAETGFDNVSKKYNRDIEGRANTLNILQFVGYGIAGAGAVVLIMSLIGDDSTESKTASGPRLVASQAGAGLGWRF